MTQAGAEWRKRVDQRLSRNENDIEDIYAMLADIQGTVRGHTAILDQHTATLVQHTATLDQHTAILDQHTATLDQHTATLDQHTATLADHGGKLDEILELLRAR